ncbi:ComEA family DNA-binding protein [Actinomadura rudentiformis]|uniref:ComEA family DNA-binding protein n=1 Tax=Actinomadura rudentiformis TaxID=359158 RepID=A0A6H9YI56_9ACTN|nr:ComEA family DNA-binding protein [Actinomadura rudentiformis]KAB2345619.1 ComEA family DNA-binding protein [Actinomadura rudentiformis]
MRFSSPTDRLYELIERLRAPRREGSGPPSSFGGGAPPAASLRSGPEAPEPPLRDRLDPGLPGARALALLGVIAALAAGVYLWMARPRPEPVTAAAPSPSLAVAAVASPAGRVVVHVSGKVRRPGVVVLPTGTRVADAIKAAGGARAGARTDALNLARKLVDGEQIPVGIPPPAAAAPALSGGPASGAPGTPLDLNAATVDQLDDLPGVGPVLAQRIVDYRTQHGSFRSVDQLQEVSGIGARRFSELKSMVRV